MTSETQRGRESRIFELEPGRNCWRIARAGRAALIVDGCDYFRLLREAMLKAERQIMVIGWDLDTRIALDEPGGRDDPPVHLGPFLSWLVRHRTGLNIHILAWSGMAYSVLGRGSTLARMARWKASRRIHFRLDGAHPREASHHQKIVVIDDSMAFCGGIDVTADRWDRREHLDDEPGRRRPTTRRRYDPWHDATMALDGGAALALGDLARLRWEAATEQRLVGAGGGGDAWPEELKPDFADIDVAIARTRGRHGRWSEVREIEAAFVDLIAAARRFVYIETQYFASRIVAEAIGERLGEPDGPEFVVVNPKAGAGWLDESVMGPARAELVRSLERRDRYGRFRIYTPVTEGGADIYVHAKIMIVDDVVLRVGSANLNNRSMGLDSECDLIVDARLAANRGAGETIARRRCDLLAEHLGTTPAEVAASFGETGSPIVTIERLRKPEGRSLRPFQPPEFPAALAAVAKKELLDPEGPDQPFEPMAGNRLLARLRRRN
ncbi:MAG TPA: phospholipase D-like domain-containing protein [Allosphingosinicella sp.]|nr:phospholipase D-like domain-containing protein [Allosphingosinicella sp.]